MAVESVSEVIGTNEATHSGDGSRQDRGLVTSGIFCTAVGCLVLFFHPAHWDFLPNWVIPNWSAPEGAGSVVCLCFPYLFLYLGFSIAIVLLAFWRILVRLFEGEFHSVWVPAIFLFTVALPILLLLTGQSFEGVFLDYGLGRYDKVIKVIERYEAKNGIYPESLDALVPDYLRSKPGIYLAFGQKLDYAPVAEGNDSVPFKFELCGIFFEGGGYGHVLKYCPVEFSCPGNNRVNDKWVWVHDFQRYGCTTD